MPKICYTPVKFAPKTLAMINLANQIIENYHSQGYDLTLRQLYYQLVSKDLIANRMSEYKRLGGIISDARRAGLIDWNAIVDRTRYLRGLNHWDSAEDIIAAAAQSFRFDKWEDQPYRVEVWIEKDALVGVFERVCNELDIPVLSCRGYASDSELWGAAQRLRRYKDKGQTPVILHFGDHDPSGCDMSRDIEDRLYLFSRRNIEVRRLALNMDQVLKYAPPPNPAKESDARFQKYMDEHGDESWELDALEPTILAGLVRDEVVNNIRDAGKWASALEREEEARKDLTETSKKWDAVTHMLPRIAQFHDILPCGAADHTGVTIDGDGDPACTTCGNSLEIRIEGE